MNRAGKRAGQTSHAAGRLACAILLIACIAWCGTGYAADSGDKRVLEEITITELTSFVKSEGYIVEKPEKDGPLRFKMEGVKVQLFIYDEGEAIQFHCGWVDTDATLEKINTWNRTKRFSRAYLDEDGDPHLELDLDLEGGVTLGRMKSFLATCRLSLSVFRQEVL